MRDDIHKIAVPCDCSCSVLLITEFEKYGDDPQQFYFDFYTQVKSKPYFRDRIKNIWAILRGKDIIDDCIVLSPEHIEQVRDFFNEHLPVRA